VEHLTNIKGFAQRVSQQIQMGIIQIVGGGTPPDHRWAKQILEKWLSNRDTMVSKNNMSLNVPGAEERYPISAGRECGFDRRCKRCSTFGIA